LDQHRGALFASSYEYPGRYTRWDMGFVDPPLVLTSRERSFGIRALNARGRLLLPAVARAVAVLDAVASFALDDDELTGMIKRPSGRFPEELRSKQPSVFSL